MGLYSLAASGFLQVLSAPCVCVLFSSSQDVTSFHASDSACDLKSKVLWCGLGLFGILSETLTSETRELDNMTNPIKTGQIVLGLKIRGFETCDFSFYVITPKSKDIAVKDFFLVCLHTHTHIGRKTADIYKK